MNSNCSVPQRTMRSRRVEANYVPRVNTYTSSGNFHVEFALPGWRKDEINIAIEDRILTVSGKVEQGISDDAKYTRKSFEKKPFSRRFKLNEQFDLEKIDATMEQGILTISLKQVEKEKFEINIK